MSCVVCRLIAVAWLGVFVTGCGLVQTTKEVSHESMKMFRPKPNDYRDPTSETEDVFSELGKSAQSMRPAEKSNDPLRKILLSPKAQSIERNLGVE